MKPNLHFFRQIFQRKHVGLIHAGTRVAVIYARIQIRIKRHVLSGLSLNASPARSWRSASASQGARPQVPSAVLSAPISHPSQIEHRAVVPCPNSAINWRAPKIETSRRSGTCASIERSGNQLYIVSRFVLFSPAPGIVIHLFNSTCLK